MSVLVIISLIISISDVVARIDKNVKENGESADVSEEYFCINNNDMDYSLDGMGCN